MKTRIVACWCKEWPEDREPQYGYSLCHSLDEAKSKAIIKAEKSDYPDFAEVYEDIAGRYGWDRVMTYFFSDGQWLTRSEEDN